MANYCRRKSKLRRESSFFQPTRLVIKYVVWSALFRLLIEDESEDKLVDRSTEETAREVDIEVQISPIFYGFS